MRHAVHGRRRLYGTDRRGHIRGAYLHCHGTACQQCLADLPGIPSVVGVILAFNLLIGGPSTWTISTQAYLNSVAFATGLCPLVGHYGVRAGLAAGMLCASLCTATGALHGGLMLYNGGFTTGVAALILIPILEHYSVPKRREMKQYINLQDMITVNETVSGTRDKREKITLMS